MDSSTSNHHLQALELSEGIDALSLYRALEHISDQRHKRGVRYPLAVILSLVVLGKLAGMTSLAGIAEWVRLRADWLKAVLPLPHASFPCASTYGNVLRRVDDEEVTRVLADWLTYLSALRRCGNEPSRLLSPPEARAQHIQVILDGKTLRGTLGHVAPDQPSRHLVTLYEAQTGVVLAQQAVPDKGNEITVEATLLTPPHVHGRIVTADAMHTRAHLLCGHHPLWRRLCPLCQSQPPHRWREDLRLFWSRAASRLPRLATGAHLYQRTWAGGNPRTDRQYRVERIPPGGLAWGRAGLLPEAHGLPAWADALPAGLWD